jgi:hypothetical protein
MGDVKPWHDSVTCPDCNLPVAVPVLSRSPRESPGYDVRRLRCAACGVMWDETDDRRLVQAWWSAGAHEGRMAAGEAKERG